MKALERTYRKSERVVSKARFTYVFFLRELLIAAILGAIVALLYIYKADINGLIGKDILTDEILAYVAAGCGGLVVLLCLLEGISRWQREAVVTDRKFAARVGIFRRLDVQMPLDQIKEVKVTQNLFERIFCYGKVIVIVDAMDPLVVKGICVPLRFAQSITRQKNRYEHSGGNKKVQLVLAPHGQKKNQY
ncbi:MAG: PH domain-containing protein [Clostridia bacterium]|nr:PH domain-containing protein [Clostridia bacterium]